MNTVLRPMLVVIFAATCSACLGADEPPRQSGKELVMPRNEAEAVAALEKLGAKINGANVKRGAERPVTGVLFPRKVCDITDDDLRYLAALPALEYAYILNQKRVTGAGLKYLKGVKTLNTFDFRGTPIESKHLVHLNDMKQLHKLGLWHTAVDDAGMVFLKGLHNLEHLYLEKTQVGDKGIEALGVNPSLCNLGIEGSRVTEKGEAIMKRNFPRLGQRPLHGD